MKGINAYTADRIFTGKDWLSGQSILVKDGIIIDILPDNALPGEATLQKFPGRFLAPAFIDLQIYGAHKKLFAAYPETDSLVELNKYCRNGGAAYCMPTIATNPIEVFYKCIDVVRDYWKQGGEGVMGLHLEGPWINPVKRGAHLESLIHSPTIGEVKELLEYGERVIRMITIAPECCSPEIIKYILSSGIVVSAGHSNLTYSQAISAFEMGIPLVTHLYNAMSPLQHREPGLVGATMDHSTVMASFIPDGYHVDFAAIRIAIGVMRKRLFVITDAVTQTDIGPYRHQLEGDKYTSAGTLSGSALTMVKAAHNLVAHAKITLEEALQMCSLHPAKAIRMEDRLGQLARGFEAKIVALDEKLETATIIS